MAGNFPYAEKGSMTVEASVVVPCVLLVLAALIYICLILYQQAYIQSVASTAAERGASAWNNVSKDMYMEQVDSGELNSNPLYWRLTEGLSTDMRREKTDKVNKFVRYSIARYSLLGKRPDADYTQYNLKNLTVKCVLKDCAIYKRLEVKVAEKYDLPFKAWLKPFGMGGEFYISASAGAFINEPAEFIRNTDLAADLVREAGGKAGEKPGEVTEKIDDIFSGLSNKLKDFLKN